MSIEQLGEFHLVRRVLRTVAPEFRLLASSNLQSQESVLDLRRKTIEIGEETPIMDAVAALLFQIGHLRHKDNPKFALLYGNGISQWKGEEPELIDRLAHDGHLVDRLSAAWAEIVFCQYWPVEPAVARTLLRSRIWSHNEWKEYFAIQ